MQSTPPARTARATAWVVITGAPCAGKTAVIRELARRGYPTVPEIAREIIDAQLRAGVPPEAVRADAHGFENRVFEAKLAAEAELPADRLAFLDRALPDSIAYFILEGLDPRRPREMSRRVRYRRVFLFDRLAVERDGVRIEDDRTAAAIEALILAAYRELGYDPERVPVLPVAERADRILAAIGVTPRP
jgi:predicted ATPase